MKSKEELDRLLDEWQRRQDELLKGLTEAEAERERQVVEKLRDSYLARREKDKQRTGIND